MPKTASASWAVATFCLGFAALMPPVAGRADDQPALPSGLVTYPRGGPERTGAYPEFRMPEHPASGWKVDLHKSTGTPVVVGDRLIVGNASNALIALSLKDDSVLWVYTEADWRMYAAPVVVGERIYCASDRGVSVHTQTDGTVIWRRDIAGGTGASPLVVGDRVYMGGNDGFAYAWNAEDGAELWKTDIVKDAPADPPGFDGARARIGDNPARPEAAASDGTSVYISIFDQSRVVALDLKTGAPRWSYQAEGLARGWADRRRRKGLRRQPGPQDLRGSTR